MKFSKTTLQLVAVVIMFTIFAGYSYMSAAGTWTAPGGTAPAGNVDAPINVGSSDQTKAGGLTINGTTTVNAPVGVDALAVYGASQFSGLLTISNTAPTIKFDDTNNTVNFWTRADSNAFYVLADRDGLNNNWDTPHPLKLFVNGTTTINDYAQFANDVWANSYCDRTGNNCFDQNSIPQIPNCPAGKILESQGNGNWICGDKTTVVTPAVQLVNSQHTEAACTSLGGVLRGTAPNGFCQFSRSSCPAGWAQYNNWSTTAATFYQTQMPGESPCTPCTTGSHGWSNAAPESCTYSNYQFYGLDDNRNICSGSLTGVAKKTSIGCY